jgi:hypothetical protein
MIRSQEPPGWRRGTCTRTPVLSAERVEVSARSSNRTVGSGVGQQCLRLVEGRHSRRVASVEPLSDPPCHLLGLYRLRSTAHLTTSSRTGPCRYPSSLPAWTGRCPGRGSRRPRRTTTDAWKAPAVRPICRLPKQAQTHHLAPADGDSTRASDQPQSQCVIRPPARRPTGSPTRRGRCSRLISRGQWPDRTVLCVLGGRSPCPGLSGRRGGAGSRRSMRSAQG